MFRELATLEGALTMGPVFPTFPSVYSQHQQIPTGLASRYMPRLALPDSNVQVFQSSFLGLHLLALQKRAFQRTASLLCSNGQRAHSVVFSDPEISQVHAGPDKEVTQASHCHGSRLCRWRGTHTAHDL